YNFVSTCVLYNQYVIDKHIKKMDNYMNSITIILKELITNLYLIRRLSLYELKNKNRSNYLGMACEIINPVIQILIYWFVFGTLRNREPVEVNGIEVPFFIWLLAGFFLW